MANRLHVAILKQGVKVWNQWRKWNPRVTPDLRGADLYGADLRQANLQNATLHKADLTAARLTAAHLSAADLRWALLAGADLQQADFTGADLRGTNFQKAVLERANFCEAVLYGANLREVVLRGTILTEARFATTSIVAVDLRGVVGLETILHAGPSSIGIDTLYASAGNIPESFLRGCGVPNSMIEYARSLVIAERPIDYYSCFISYSSKDQALAERLHIDLQAAGVRCWFLHDLKIGASILGGIEQGIR